MYITHNLIFDTPEIAATFVRVVENQWPHLKGSASLKFTQHANVLVVGERTYVKLDAGGMLDNSR